MPIPVPAALTREGEAGRLSLGPGATPAAWGGSTVSRHHGRECGKSVQTFSRTSWTAVIQERALPLGKEILKDAYCALPSGLVVNVPSAGGLPLGNTHQLG